MRRLCVWIKVHLELWVDATLDRIDQLRGEAGQTVAEYALVLLVAAAIAAAFLLWARSSGRLDAFFDLIFDRLINSVDPNPTPTPVP